MIALPGYAGVVDRDEADRARANLRERNIPEESVEVEEDRVLVIGYNEQYDDFLVVRRDGSSVKVARKRVTFDITGGPNWIQLTALHRQG